MNDNDIIVAACQIFLCGHFSESAEPPMSNHDFLLAAYEKLQTAWEKDPDTPASNFVHVWAPLESYSVDDLLETIERQVTAIKTLA